MTYLSIMAAAAKAAHVSTTLLYAICAHESKDFSLDFAEYDNGSPSYGVCQVKEDTARFLGFKGKSMELRNPMIGAKYAALYLKYQLDRYSGNVYKAVAAYNAGSFIESKKRPGFAANHKYINLVKQKLDKRLQHVLDSNNTNYFIDKMELSYESR
jgi:soluble lytic murein transglycosylase-like protein